jgi:hypothetical protein
MLQSEVSAKGILTSGLFDTYLDIGIERLMDRIQIIDM